MRRATLAAVAGLVIVTILVVAVLAGRDTDQETTAAGRFGPVRSALCGARSAAARGEMAEARRLFVDHAHQGLHELAATAGDTDRAAAARLLEAKEAVERDFATASAELVGDLDGLMSTMSKAIAVTGQAKPAPCADEES